MFFFFLPKPNKVVLSTNPDNFECMFRLSDQTFRTFPTIYSRHHGGLLKVDIASFKLHPISKTFFLESISAELHWNKVDLSTGANFNKYFKRK